MTTNPRPAVSPLPLRLWPAVLVLVLMWLARALPAVVPGSDLVGLLSGVAGGMSILLWWLFLSRARWLDRIAAIAVMAAGLAAVAPLVHPSIATGMMGGLMFVYGLQLLPTALVVGALVGSRFSEAGRRASIAVAILLACTAFTLVRTDGILGSEAQFAWRWTPSAEERLLAQAGDEPIAPAVAVTPAATAAPIDEGTPAPSGSTARAADAPRGAETSTAGNDTPAPRSTTATSSATAEWPGFRGANRDGVVHGVCIATDWSSTPPVRLWQRAIGPGWSSFAVRGDLLYTQEQRGDDEVVGSYRVLTGEPVWRHRDAVRFWESNGGAGPRATPTIEGGRVYAFGATGLLNALDADTGAVVWSRDVASDTHTAVPVWGFSSSPLVVDETVIVAAEGTLAAYDIATGQRRWVGPAGGAGYSSPHRASIGGQLQVLLLSGVGATSVSPSDGTVLWTHAWPGSAIVQPALTPEGDIIVNTLAGTGGLGVRRLAITHGEEWTVAERWTSTGLKPYFSDFVMHEGYAYGFDGSILASIDLADGTRKWKGGRYGHGQLVLLADQDLLLVVTEEGELALVSATPDRFTEVARMPALDGKTWNHPVLVGNVLLVRNGEEMAAFRVPLAYC